MPIHPSDPMYKYTPEGRRRAEQQLPGSGAKPRAAKRLGGVSTSDLQGFFSSPPKPTPPPVAPVRKVASEKPPAAQPAAVSGDQAHKWYGVPDELIELLGPPPVLARHLEQFYKLLVAFAFDANAQRTTDWLIPWDQALLRVELGQLGRGKATTVALHYDRAACEITRQGALRFVRRDPFARITREFDPRMVEFDEPPVDYGEMNAELSRLGLPQERVMDLAYIVAAPMLEPVEAIEARKRNQLRQLDEDLQRRRDRTDRRRAESGQDEAIDADFEAVAESQPGLKPNSQPELNSEPGLSPPVPGEKDRDVPTLVAPSEPSLQADEVAAPPVTDALGQDVEEPPSGVAAGGSLGEAIPLDLEAREDGDLF